MEKYNEIDKNENSLMLISNNSYRIEEKKYERIINISLMIISSIIYFSSIIYGLVLLIESSFTNTQANLIIIQSVGASLVPFIFPFLGRYFKIKVNTPIRIGVLIFAFMGVFLGETLGFYYNVQYWDKFLHATSGAGVTLIAYCLMSNYLSDKTEVKRKTLACITFALLVSFATAMLWEIYEFTCDTLEGTNMQKFMPENNLFNGGNTNALLEGTDAEIAAFYKTPEGYRFALIDTMGDMIACFIGSNVFIMVSIIINKIAKANLFVDMIEIKSLKNALK